MSDTPRTDEFQRIRDNTPALEAEHDYLEALDFARQLERELEAALVHAGKETGRAEAAARPEEKDTAWLIESVGGRWGTGYFWKGVTQYGTWGTIDEAVRFARKADADRVIESLHADDIKRYGYKQELKYEACEHQWPSSPLDAQFKETK